MKVRYWILNLLCSMVIADGYVPKEDEFYPDIIEYVITADKDTKILSSDMGGPNRLKKINSYCKENLEFNFLIDYFKKDRIIRKRLISCRIRSNFF